LILKKIVKFKLEMFRKQLSGTLNLIDPTGRFDAKTADQLLSQVEGKKRTGTKGAPTTAIQDLGRAQEAGGSIRFKAGQTFLI